MNEEKYIKGFNSGYTLASHKPELLQTMAENLPPANDYVAGLLDGKSEREDEKRNEQFKAMEELRNRSADKENSIEG